MSEENVELVRRGYELFNEGGPEALISAGMSYSHAIPAMQEDAAAKIAALLER
jgi:hypothetical protein